MQHRFVVKMLEAAKRMGIHTTIETNGFYGSRLSGAELDTIDLVMLGIKTWGEARHRELVGGGRKLHRFGGPKLHTR